MLLGKPIALAARALVSMLIGITLAGCSTLSETTSADQIVESLQNRNGAP